MRVACLAWIGLFFIIGNDNLARAASFDCTRAISPREHLICNDPALSKADEELADLYKSKLALLSPDDANLLRDSERSWFVFTNTTCRLRPNSPRGPVHFETPGKCLAGAYADRSAQLSDTGPNGPYIFVRVDTYIARPTTGSGDEDAHSPGFDTNHSAYFQIDRARGAAELAWNLKARADAAHALVAADDADEDRNVTLGIATHHLISLRSDAYEYGHGMPHGMNAASVWNAELGDTLRDLAPADLFGSNRDWKSALGDIGLSAIEENGWQPIEPDAEKEMRQSVTGPKYWLIKPAGLEIVFSSYDGGYYACTPDNGLISWDKLRPILSQAFIDTLAR